MSRRVLQRFVVAACAVTCLMVTATPAFGADPVVPPPSPAPVTSAPATPAETAISATTASIGTAVVVRRPRRITMRMRRARDRKVVAHGATKLHL